MNPRYAVAIGSIALLSVAICPVRIASQPIGKRILERLETEFEAAEQSWILSVAFSVPVRYIRHSPQERGNTIRVQVSGLTGLAPATVLAAESLRPDSGSKAPVDGITLAQDADGTFSLEVRLRSSMRFEVAQGADLREIRIVLRDVAADPAAANRGAFLVDEGRKALTAGELDRAIGIFTAAASLPANPSSPDARELLGLARERNGQLAHAKAEYEAYLSSYPAGEGAARVRQRLDVMLSARDEPATRLGDRPAETRKLDLETYGSIYVGYRRESHFTDVFGEQLMDSTLFSDGFLSTRLRTDGYRYQIETAGGYRYDFIQDESETRTRSLFFRFDDERRDISLIAGRQTRSQGGVLGRFDGVFASVRAAKRLELRAVAGFPVDYSSYDKVDFARQFFGFSVDVSAFSEALDVELFAIQQMADGRVDRRAVGAEVRYADATRFVAGFLDYDIYFNSLNVALLTGNWQVEPHTRVNFLADYRNTPVLTATNALQGQNVGSLSDLRDLFTPDEIDDLARDRTAKSATLGGGVSHDLNDWLQFALDANVTWLSATPDSGGVDGLDSQGIGVTSLAQLIASDLVRPGDVGILGFRVTHGSDTDAATLSLDFRVPVGRALRINPRIAGQYRIQNGDGTFSLLPVLRADLRLGSLIFDFEGGIEWSIPPGTPDVKNEWGYYMSCGVRHDF